ncbi:MAG: hypothetical protein ACI865_002012 [Flavobacteriaceae bacterium]
MNYLINFSLVKHKNNKEMGILGTVIFLLIGGMAFWLLVFLMGFILPYWIHLGAMEKLRPKRILEDTEK